MMQPRTIMRMAKQTTFTSTVIRNRRIPIRSPQTMNRVMHIPTNTGMRTARCTRMTTLTNTLISRIDRFPRFSGSLIVRRLLMP